MKKLIKFNGNFNPAEGEFFLIVNIKKSFYCNDPHSCYYRENVYECARKSWVIAEKKTKKITRVIGHVNGIVQCVIKPNRWYKIKKNGQRDRYECSGIEENNSTYLGKSLNKIIKFGQNPVNYYASQSTEEHLYYIESIHEIYGEIEQIENDRRDKLNISDRRNIPTGYHVALFSAYNETVINVETDDLCAINENFEIEEVSENSYVYYHPESKMRFQSANDSSIVQERVNSLHNLLSSNIDNGTIREEIHSINSLFRDNYNQVFSYHINVGHGNCSIILIIDAKCNYKLLMIDCGLFDYKNMIYYNDNLNKCFEDISCRVRKDKKDLRISHFLLTHTHYDHYSGIDFLFTNNYIDNNTVFVMNAWYGCISPSWIKIYKKITNNKNVIIEPIRKNLGCVIYPEIRQVSCKQWKLNRKERIVRKPNNSSVVYSMCFNNAKMVLPGDLEIDGFNNMTKKHYCRYDLHECKYYCISHHGSQTGHIAIPCLSLSCSVFDCCINGLKYAILMGRDCAFHGIYSRNVIRDFKPILIYSEKDNIGHTISFFELDWMSNNIKYHY